jgi:hypothetical protein
MIINYKKYSYMTDWTDIHDDFTDKLQLQWEKYGFEF